MQTNTDTYVFTDVYLLKMGLHIPRVVWTASWQRPALWKGSGTSKA